MSIKFKILHHSKRSKARLGLIFTEHGIIKTPNFVPVGTNGSIKCLDSIQLNNIGIQLMFCNTYHLFLQPGLNTIEKHGGIHNFINRPLPIITDSGGFQIFSLLLQRNTKEEFLNLQSIAKTQITEEGAHFYSYKTGKKFLFTPELSIQAQKKIGADIILCFDELNPFYTKRDEIIHSFERTHRWEKRSLTEHLKTNFHQGLYGIIHGGLNIELRKKSSQYLKHLAFDGFCIGGNLGHNKQTMIELIKNISFTLPNDRPIHLLGIGDVPSIEKCIQFGIDTFDSSYPTKAARHGVFLQINRHSINLNNTLPSTPLQDCLCYTCKNFSFSFIHHLYKAKEPTSLSLLSIHNLYVMMQIMKNYRELIANDLL